MAVKAVTLEECNVYVIVDRSGSMSGRDMPNGQSRWDYVKEYATGLVTAVSKFDEDGLDVCFFDDRLDIVEGVSDKNFASEWNKRSPRNSTMLEAPLKWALDLHFARKAKGESRSSLILVFTDGEPSDKKKDIANRIIDASNRLGRDEELAILFIHVGTDRQAGQFLASLDDDLQGLGAKYDIVDVKTTDDIDKMTPDQLVEAAFND